MAVSVDEARNDDPIRSVDHGHRVSRHREVRPDLANLAVLNQHVRLREVADPSIEGQHHAALDEDTALHLQAAQLGLGVRSADALGKSASGRDLATAPPAARAAPALRNARREDCASAEASPATRRISDLV